MSIRMAARLPGPPEIVWRLLTDWEHQDEWMLEASEFRVTSPHREGVGVEAEATIRIAGISTRDRVRVVGWRPQEHLAIEHLGWVTGTGVIDLAGRSDRSTDLTWEETLRCPPLGIVGSVGLWLLRPALRSIFVRDLRVLTALVRARTDREPA